MQLSYNKTPVSLTHTMQRMPFKKNLFVSLCIFFVCLRFRWICSMSTQIYKSLFLTTSVDVRLIKTTTEQLTVVKKKYTTIRILVPRHYVLFSFIISLCDASGVSTDACWLHKRQNPLFLVAVCTILIFS